MLFNSIGYLFFLPSVFFIFWAFRNNYKWQNSILFVASYYFYSCWDYRFVILLFISTLVDFYAGLKISQSDNIKHKKRWMLLSVFLNLCLLFIFKYFNFFIDSITSFNNYLGGHLQWNILNIILPVGISFYTFHGISYIIDIYNKKIDVEKNFITYSVFVSFFPLLVAGPIERATTLLPQLKIKRRFEYSMAIIGLRQMLWGFFKKIVIADNCGEVVNSVFGHSNDYSCSTHFLAAAFFAFQIYADFSGYSDIALGSAKLFGINLINNFSYPYFSRDIAEFWRRWNISLSSWFRDYLYIPLGGSKRTLLVSIRNIFIIFIISGLWHGASMNYIFWGFLNALYFIPLFILNKNRKNFDIVAKHKQLPNFNEVINIVMTFSLTVFAWIFFRSKNISSAFIFIIEMFSFNNINKSHILLPGALKYILFLFLLIEWQGRAYTFPIESFALKWPKFARITFYYLLVFLILFYMDKKKDFIYFQF